MRRDTTKPSAALTTAMIPALMPMRQYSECNASLTLVSGTAARTTASTGPLPCVKGMATYVSGTPSVGLVRVAMPTWPASAALTSGLSLWFCMVDGSCTESARTRPLRLMIVKRVPEAAPRPRIRLSSLAVSHTPMVEGSRPWRIRARASSSVCVCFR